MTDDYNLFSNQQPVDNEQPESRGVNRRIAISITLAYVLVVVALAVVASNFLHDWARMRIVDSYGANRASALAAARHTNLAPAAEITGAAAELPASEQTAVASAPAASTIPAINVLLIGTDARPNEQGIPLTDTLILLTLDPQTMTAGLLSLPRDLWVPIPGMDTTTKINIAYRLGEEMGYDGGGPQLIKDTVSSFIGQPVPYYVRVSFDGFEEIMDLIGGIDVVVPVTIDDDKYPTSDYGYETFYLEAGTQHLDGETALKYVRTRNVDSDYGRARRQQQVIRAVADKVMRAEMIPSLLAKAPRLLYTMRSSIETDMPMAVQLELANYFADGSLNEIRQLVLDGRYGEETYSEEGAWILLPDRQRVRAALNTFFSPVPQNSDPNTVATNNQSWVRVEILNGTGEQGVAARMRDVLQAQGWQVVAIGDADRSDYSHTLIVNYGVPSDLVSRISGDLKLQPNLSTLAGLNPTVPVDMRIVVGRDFLSDLPE